MTSPAELIKTAATEIDRLTAENEQLKSDNVAMAQSIKTASDKQVKTAADLGDLANTACKLLLDKGVLRCAQDSDKLAAAIVADQSQALKTIAKIAGYISTVQKLGSVVQTSDKPETSDQVWERSISAYIK